VDRQLAQDVSAYHAGRELAGTFGITVTLRPDRSIDEVRVILEQEIREIADCGVSADELARVVTMKTASFFFALEHMGGFGGVADRLNAYNIFRNDPALVTADLMRFRLVTVESIGEVAVRYLHDKPRVTLSVLGRKSSTVHSPVDRKAAPSSAAPAAYRAPLPERLKLGNGIPIWVLSHAELPTIAMTVALGGGGSLQPPARAGLAQLTISMMDEGTRSRSATQIAMAAEAMGTSLSTSLNWDGAFVSIRCLSSVLEPSLDLLVDILRWPSFPPSEWERVHAQTIAGLRAERDSAEARAYRGLLAALYDDSHPYRHPLEGAESVVAELGRAEAVEFHQRFLGPARAGVIIAGDVHADAIVKLLEARLGDWEGPGVTAPLIPDPFLASRPRILLLNRPGAAQAAVRVGHVGIARSDVDYEHAMLINHVLGGQFTSRLNEKLREERGLTYGVRSQFDCRLGRGPFSIATSVQTDKVAEALSEMCVEVRALLGDLPATQTELEDSRRALIEGQTRHFETPPALVNRYANLFIHDLPIDHYATFPERLAEVNLDALNAAMHRQMHPDSLIAVVVADVDEVGKSLKRLEWADLELVQD
jgi:zinc protease